MDGALARQLGAEFEEFARSTVGALKTSLAGSPPADMLDLAIRAAHNLIGQGDSFDYPLVSRIARSLDRLARAAAADRVSVPLRRAVEAHLDALAVVIEKRIRGDAGALGDRLAARLEAMPTLS